MSELRFTIYCGLAVGQDTSPSTIRRSREKVYRFADEYLSGYTITEGIGRWRGKQEPTTIITFVTDRKTDITKVNGFCHAYKWNNNQESVLFTEEEVKITFY
jgi:hypothetical protein